METKLFNLAYYDSLTRLPNKEMLIKDFNKVIKYSLSDGEIKLAFFLIDIDNFGYINSFLGYEEGNIVIKRFAEFLLTRYPDDLVSRVNADEFLVLYKYKSSLSNIEIETKKLLQTIRDYNFINEYEVKLTASIGVSVYKNHGEGFYDLLKNADIALYSAKKCGKDSFKIYQEYMESNVFHYVELDNQIRLGLLKKEFQMYYQPIVDVQTGFVAGLEALIRWNHGKKGYVAPGEFLHIAEETGRIVILEQWIIEDVFKQAKAWCNKGEISIFISINLSPKGLIQNNLDEFLDKMLKKYKVNPKIIKFEVTETAMIEDVSNSIHLLNTLVEKGFNVSLDDFGTGYSSLNYLRNLPITEVKLDKSFIDSILERKKDMILVESIIKLCHKFNLKVIAEGVEFEEQVRLLKNMGCDYIQGYYYGKPMNVIDTEDWIRKNNIYKYNKK